MNLKMQLVVRVGVRLIIPCAVLAQAGFGTVTGDAHLLAPTFKPVVLEVNPGAMDDLAQTRVVNGLARGRACEAHWLLEQLFPFVARRVRNSSPKDGLVALCG
jgi:hypothetical protein